MGWKRKSEFIWLEFFMTSFVQMMVAIVWTAENGKPDAIE